jgi:hypothetical protein
MRILKEHFQIVKGNRYNRSQQTEKKGANSLSFLIRKYWVSSPGSISQKKIFLYRTLQEELWDIYKKN